MANKPKSKRPAPDPQECPHCGGRVFNFDDPLHCVNCGLHLSPERLETESPGKDWLVGGFRASALTKGRRQRTKTVAQLRAELAKFPDDARWYAYEGERSGIGIVRGRRFGFIPSDSPDTETFQEEE